MPIKRVHVGFDIDMDVFMKMLQHGNSNVSVEMYGDTPKVKAVKPKPLLLPPPERVGAKKIIMDYARLHKDMGFKPKELMPLIVAAGYSKNTHSPQLMWLSSRKYLRKDSEGTYYPTAKGLTYGEA
jgi:hypothetical protein